MVKSVEVLLVVSGSVFALVLVVGSLLRIRRSSLGFVDLFPAFAAALITLAGMTVDALDGALTSVVVAVVMLMGSVLGIVGIVIALVEVLRPQRLRASRGLLTLGVAALIVAARFAVPLTSRYFELTPPGVSSQQPVAAVTGFTAAAVSRTQTVTASITVTTAPTLTPSATRTPRPTPTPSLTRVRYASPTPSLVPTLPSPCVVVTLYNVNVRTQPDLEAELLLTIPFETALNGYGRTAGSDWWYVQYRSPDDPGQAIEGWVSGDFVRVTASCGLLPVRDSR